MANNPYNSASLFNEQFAAPSYGVDGTYSRDPVSTEESPSQIMGKGAVSAMNAGGTAGQVATSAGLMGLMAGAKAVNPYVAGASLAGGLLLSQYENEKKNEAADERAKVEEAEKRKASVQMALNQALGATKMLGV